MAAQPTYSCARPVAHNKDNADNLFDGVVADKLCSEEKSSQNLKTAQKRPNRKRKNKKAQSKPDKKTKDDEELSEASLTMFQVDDVPQGKKKKSNAKQVPNRKTSNAKKDSKPNQNEVHAEVYSYESPGTSPLLHIESCSSKKITLFNEKSNALTHFEPEEKKKNASTKVKQSQVLKTKERKKQIASKDGKKKEKKKRSKSTSVERWLGRAESHSSESEYSSVEHARDCSIIPLSVLRNKSPLHRVVASDVSDDSFGYLEPGLDDIDMQKWGDSSGIKDSESQYTYVSTYTYGSATTTTSSMRTPFRSPHVLQGKRPKHLNSSVRRGKRDICEDRFPDFISPIHQVKGNRKSGGNKQHLQKSSEKESDGQPDRKCSTLIFLSESGSNAKQLETFGLTAIPSKSNMSKDSKSRDKDQNSHEQVMDTHKVITSTPRGEVIPVCLSVSPVRMPSWNSDELGFPIADNHAEITSEIIVPSLMEPTVLVEQDGLSHRDGGNEENVPEKPPNNGAAACPAKDLSDSGRHSTQISDGTAADIQAENCDKLNNVSKCSNVVKVKPTENDSRNKLKISDDSVGDVIFMEEIEPGKSNIDVVTTSLSEKLIAVKNVLKEKNTTSSTAKSSKRKQSSDILNESKQCKQLVSCSGVNGQSEVLHTVHTQSLNQSEKESAVKHPIQKDVSKNGDKMSSMFEHTLGSHRRSEEGNVDQEYTECELNKDAESSIVKHKDMQTKRFNKDRRVTYMNNSEQLADDCNSIVETSAHKKDSGVLHTNHSSFMLEKISKLPPCFISRLCAFERQKMNNVKL